MSRIKAIREKCNIFKGKSLAKLASWFIIIVVIFTNGTYQYWNDSNHIIENDTIEYYAYLPAVFIYQDLDLLYKGASSKEVSQSLWALNSQINKHVIKTTNGVSILYTPFFLLAHLFTKVTNIYPANGYSAPYKIGLILSSIFYLFLGLYFMRRLLSRYFDDTVVALTLIIVVLGTNLFNYVTKEPIMEHVYGFFMLMTFMYYVVKWYKKPHLKYASLIGIIFGLIVLSRPSNILIGLFFLLFGINNKSTIKQRLKYFQKHYGQIILMGILSILVWVPQFIYWSHQTGKWLFFSYGSDERFFWTDPEIIAGLFSYRKGWLLYTPLMAFSLIGIFFLRKRLKAYLWPTVTIILLSWYMLFSWWCWWYGGSYGMRAMIDLYALLSVPLAAFIQYIWKQKRIIRNTFIILVFLLVGLNQFQTQKYRYMSIHWDSMTKEAYWQTFFDLYPSPKYYKLLKEPDYDKARKGIR